MYRFLAVFITLTSLCTSSLDARELESIVKEGKLRVAIDTTYPPMEFQADDGKIIGLDVDLAREIAKILKVEVDFIVMPWDGILAGLKSSRYDIIMSSMNITPERSQQVNFVPYIMMGQVFVVKKSAKPIKNEKDLKGLVIAVQADTTSFAALEAFQKSGIAIKEIKAFKAATDTFSALKSNQADGIIIDEAVGLYYTGLDQKSFQISGMALKPSSIGIAVRKTDGKLLKALEAAVKTIKENGTFAKIYKQWLKLPPAQ